MTNDQDELKSFKIADMRRSEIRSFSREASKSGRSAPEEQVSLGFPAIEHQLENGDLEAVAEILRPSYEKLEALEQSGGLKEKANAKKALAAYERTADLFEYLFDTKNSLVEDAQTKK